MKKLAVIALALAILVSSPVWAETLNNRSIVALTASGIGDEAIIAKIRSSDQKFDLSTDQMIALKKQGVSGSVIAVMIAASDHTADRASPVLRSKPITRSADGSGRPASPSVLYASRPSGIYLLSGGQLVRLNPNVSGQTKTGGFLGSALSYGIAKISTKVVLQGEHARIKTSDSLPTFYFYLTAGASSATQSSFAQQSSEPASPDEFSLLRLQVKDGSREARIGRGNVTGYQSGVVSKDRTNFHFEEARPGVFSVSPSAPLAPGEYSFVMIGGGGASVAKFFDFSVQ